MMDKNSLLIDAFGSWEPETDRTAVLKFCVADIFQNGGYGWLVTLLDSITPVEFHGDPGWELERQPPDNALSEWPKNAVIRAKVPVGLVGIEYHEGYFDLDTFLDVMSHFISVFPHEANQQFIEMIETYESTATSRKANKI